MGIGCRRFIVDDEGRLVRLRNAIFERLLRDPQHHTMPALAGQRVRMAEILVQLADRRPIQVVRRVYFVVGFDEVWAAVRSCLNLVGLKLLTGSGRRAAGAVAVGASNWRRVRSRSDPWSDSSCPR